jgi:hypothetical protein
LGRSAMSFVSSPALIRVSFTHSGRKGSAFKPFVGVFGLDL